MQRGFTWLAGRRLPRRPRLPDRSPVAHHVPVRHLHRWADLPVLDRLHARRPELLQVLPLPELLRALHARAGAGIQPARHLPRMGGRGRGVVLPDRVLVPGHLERERRQEGVHHQPRRRLGLHDGDVLRLLRLRHAQLHADVRPHRQRRPHHAHRHRGADPRRRRRQVGPAPALRVAARRHGRPHPGFRPHPRRHHGDRRRLPAGAHEPHHQRRRPLGQHADRLRSARSPRSSPPPSPSASATSRRCWPTPRSASSATWCWPSAAACVRRRHLPHDHARLLQGPALPRRRLGHPRHEQRAGHGLVRPAPEVHPDHRSVTFIVGWLAIAGVPPFAGFWSKGDILGFAWHKSTGALRDRPGHRHPHRLLHDP